LIKAFLFFLLGSACSWGIELPYGGWWLILGLAVYLSFIARSTSPFKSAWLFGLGYFCNALWWIYISLQYVGGVPFALSIFAVFALSTYLAITPALAYKLSSRFQRPYWRVLVIASSWTIFEWVRGQLFTGFPWAGIAESQMDGPFSPIATYLGGLACTWLAIATAGYIGQIKSSFFTKLLVIIFGISIVQLLNLIHFTTPIGKPIEVTLIQGNFPQSTKFDPRYIAEQIDYYRRVVNESNTTLTVIPETAIPIPEKMVPPQVMEEWERKTSDKHIISGVIGQTEDGRYANSALGFGPRIGYYRYDKNHLVPFGEFVPWGFQWFIDQFHTPVGNFKRGGINQKPFPISQDLKTINAGIMICYEDVFGDELAKRQRLAPEPHNLWVNLTNLAWFGDSQAAEQQLRLARLRSLETGIPTIRATNTGITAVINHQGNVMVELPEFQQISLKTEVQAYTGITPYVKYGDWPILLICLGFLVLAYRQEKK
jgi:apolipoprotein N-acyltransferase